MSVKPGAHGSAAGGQFVQSGQRKFQPFDVSRDQSEEMKAAMSAWKVVYWEPHLAQLEAEKRAARINREFASHFRPPSAWRRFRALFRRNDSPLSLIIEDRPIETSPREAQGLKSSDKMSGTEQLELLRR